MASPGPFHDQPRRVVGATLVVAAVVAAFAVAYLLSDVLLLLFVGVLLATALEPVINALQRRGVWQPVAVGTVYICTAFLLAVGIIVVAPYLMSQVRGLLSEVPRAGNQAHQWLENAGDALWANVARRLVAEIPSGKGAAEVEQALATVGQTASYLATAARGLLTACLAVVLAFYWSLQGDRTIRWLLLLLPVARRDATRDTIAEIEGKVGAYIRGQGLVCLAMAGMATAVYSLMGLRYAIVLGLVAGLLEVVPVFGPILAAIPALGVTLFTAAGKTPWVLLAAVLMQQAENYLLVPSIMGKSVGVHPMVTLLAIVAFGSLFGVAGAILAIPLAAIVQVLLHRYMLNHAAAEIRQPSGRGVVSVLHYDAQQLLRDIRLRDKAEPPAAKSDRFGEAVEAIARDLADRLQGMEDGSDVEGEP
jgi:predicted PurR-regulated permease PerM